MRALPLPLLSAGSIGVLLMARHGTPPSQLAVQIAALAIGALLALSIPALGRERLLAIAPWAAGIGLALLGATLLGDGLLSVHRWITLGPIHIHASSLACPTIVIAAAALLSRDRWAQAGALLAAGQIVHLIQPDAGQATALAAGGIAALAASTKTSLPRRAGFAIALAVAAALTLPRADPLPQVPIVEGIVHLAGDLGRPFQALAIVSLACLPLAIALAARRAIARGGGLGLAKRARLDWGAKPPSLTEGDAFARSAGVGLTSYVAASILVPLWGNFPVPVMGYGVSPILGTAICLGVAGATASSRCTPG